VFPDKDRLLTGEFKAIVTPFLAATSAIYLEIEPMPPYKLMKIKHY